MFVALQFVASYKFSGPDVGAGRSPALRSATTFRACCATLQEKKNALTADGGKSKFKAAEPAGYRLQTGSTAGVFHLDLDSMSKKATTKKQTYNLISPLFLASCQKSRFWPLPHLVKVIHCWAFHMFERKLCLELHEGVVTHLGEVSTNIVTLQGAKSLAD